MFQIIKNPEYGVFYYWTLITKTMQANVLVRKQTFKIKNSLFSGKWLRGPDLNQRPSGYEPDELPSCSTPRPILNRVYRSDVTITSNQYNGAEKGT